MIDPRTQHRPDDRDRLMREAERLFAGGLSIFDIGQALNVPAGVVRSLLQPVFDSPTNRGNHHV